MIRLSSSSSQVASSSCSGVFVEGVTVGFFSGVRLLPHLQGGDVHVMLLPPKGNTVRKRRMLFLYTEMVVVSARSRSCTTRTASRFLSVRHWLLPAGDQLVGNVDFCLLEAMLQILAYGSTGNDAEENVLRCGFPPDLPVGLQIIAHLVFLAELRPVYIHINHRDGNVLITDALTELFGYADNFFLQVMTLHWDAVRVIVRRCLHTLAIVVFNSPSSLLMMIGSQALRCLVQVKRSSFTNEHRKSLPGHTLIPACLHHCSFSSHAVI